jgi:hypothetical protein
VSPFSLEYRRQAQQRKERKELNHSDLSEFSGTAGRVRRIAFKNAGSLMIPAELSFATTAAVTIDVRIMGIPFASAYLAKGLRKSNDRCSFR